MTKGDIIDGFKSLNVNEPDAEAMLMSMPGEMADFAHNGGSAVIAGDGSYITEPVFDRSGIVFGEIDLKVQREAAQTLDTSGHYSRPDVFELTVNTAPQPGVKFKDS